MRGAESITARTSGTSHRTLRCCLEAELLVALSYRSRVLLLFALLFLLGRVQRRYALTSNITKRCIGERHGFLNFQSEKRTMDCHPNDLKGNKDEKKQQPSAKGKQGGAANQGEHR